MSNYNRVVLIGHLTRDPEVRTTSNGHPMMNLRMAMNRRWRGADEQLKEEVTFVDVASFGPQVESMGKYLKKGSPLLVDGRLRWHEWENDKGEKRSKLDVTADRLSFLPRNEGGPRRDAAEAEGSERALPF
jgi:single-strand DNA-binding protein